MTHSFSYHHVIPSRTVAAEVRTLERLLTQAGYDPVDLDLEKPAARLLVKNAVAVAAGAGVIGVSKGYLPRPTGEVDIVFNVNSDAERVMLKLALT